MKALTTAGLTKLIQLIKSSFISVDDTVTTTTVTLATVATSGDYDDLINKPTIPTGKADVDLSNVNNTGTSSGASWAMPSNTYEDLTLGASGTDYTAPANGWISFVKQATGNQFIQFNNVTAGWFNNVNSASNGQYISIICPVKKGDIFQISYNTGGGTAQFIFIYAQGSESEAS